MHRLILIGLLTAGLAAVEPNLEDGVMARGYDVVAYHQGEAREGSADITAEHAGATYRFATAANKQTFLADPQRYVPAYGGWCAYAMADGEQVNIHPERFKLIDGRTHLFYDGFWGDTLAKWNRAEDELKPKADAAWQRLTAGE